MSAFIPNLNEPVNDETLRITLRWKTTVEVSRLSQSSSQMTASIYKLFNKLFSDDDDLLFKLFSNDDDLLFKWDDDGMENFNSISKMTPAEARLFISPSITIIPTQSMVIIPIRCGFTGRNSITWKNHNQTKAALDRNNVMV
jgi:hypothetical protein